MRQVEQSTRDALSSAAAVELDHIWATIAGLVASIERIELARAIDQRKALPPAALH